MSQTVIHVGNHRSRIETKNAIMKALVPAFKFRAPGYIFDPRVKRGIWDGFTWFLDKDGNFLTGLLPEVEAALQKLSEPYTIEWKIDAVEWAHEPDEGTVSVRGADGEIHSLRDYQVEFLRRVKTWSRGVVKAATGAGKSAIEAGVVLMAPPMTPTLVVMRSRTLAEQTYGALRSAGVERVGIVHGGKWEPDVVTVCLLQSVHKLSDLFPHIRLLIVDEVHEAVGKQGLKLYRSLPKCFARVGFSATPFKTSPPDQVHNYTVKGWFGPTLGEVSTAELQERNLLAQSRVHVIEIDEPSGSEHEMMEYQGAYKACVVENDRFHAEVAHLVSGLKGRTLIVVERVEHGDRLKTLIPDAKWVQGKDDDRTRGEVIEALRTAEGDVVAISTKIFSVGVDVFIHNLVNCAGMKAEVSTIQRLGRGLRLAPDKDRLDYYDFYFPMNKHLRSHSRRRIKILKAQGHEVVE